MADPRELIQQLPGIGHDLIALETAGGALGSGFISARLSDVAVRPGSAGMFSRTRRVQSARDKTGATPLGYLTTWRLFRAKTLLRATGMSLQEIAIHVG